MGQNLFFSHMTGGMGESTSQHPFAKILLWNQDPGGFLKPMMEWGTAVSGNHQFNGLVGFGENLETRNFRMKGGGFWRHCSLSQFIENLTNVIPGIL